MGFKKYTGLALLAALLLLPGFVTASDWGICRYLDPSSALYRDYCAGGMSGLTRQSLPDSATQRSTNIIMGEVVMPRTLTTFESDGRQISIEKPRLIGGYLRYESARVENQEDADIYGGTIGMAWETEQVTLGIIFPYDYMDYSVIKAHRFGAVGFGAYSFGLAQGLDLRFGAHASYMRVNPFDEPEGMDSSDVNYFGGGLSTTLTYDTGVLVPALAVMYQYTKDDSDNEEDYSHLLKVGGQLGVRMGERFVLSPFVIWNRDLSSYANSDDIYNFFDAGVEMGISVSETFTLNAGYKKVLGISDIDNDMGYLGFLYRF